MIDIDRYEGHTEGPWDITTWLKGDPNEGGIIPASDMYLFNDAPLLLEEVKRLRDIICLLEDSRIRGLSIFDRPQLFDDVLQVHTQRNEQGNGDLPCWTLFEGFGDEE